MLHAHTPADSSVGQYGPMLGAAIWVEALCCRRQSSRKRTPPKTLTVPFHIIEYGVHSLFYTANYDIRYMASPAKMTTTITVRTSSNFCAIQTVSTAPHVLAQPAFFGTSWEVWDFNQNVNLKNEK